MAVVYAWEWKRHDIGQSVAARGTLKDAAGNAVDLTNAVTLTLKYVPADGGTLVNRTAVKDSDQTTNRGKWSYAPIAGDTALGGDFNFEIEVDWGVNGTQTFPTRGQYVFHVEDDLDSA
jgi:hypothetical protein